MAFFAYDFDNHFAFIWKPLGARRDRDGVELTGTRSEGGRFVATYGRRRLETSLDNVDAAHITENYRWWKAIGTRLSAADDGLTFGTNARRGVCVHFTQRVPRVLGPRDHSAVTVTVADPEGLVAALEDAGPEGDGE